MSVEGSVGAGQEEAALAAIEALWALQFRLPGCLCAAQGVTDSALGHGTGALRRDQGGPPGIAPGIAPGFMASRRSSAQCCGVCRFIAVTRAATKGDGWILRQSETRPNWLEDVTGQDPGCSAVELL